MARLLIRSCAASPLIVASTNSVSVILNALSFAAPRNCAVRKERNREDSRRVPRGSTAGIVRESYPEARAATG